MSELSDNLSSAIPTSPNPDKTGSVIPFGPSDPAAIGNLSISVRLRVVLYLINGVSHGGKVEAAQKIAASLGVSLRSIYRWRRMFRQSGISGLSRRPRCDRGRPRLLTPEIFRAIYAHRGALKGNGDIAQLWRFLGKPSTYETFRVWCRFVQDQSQLIDFQGVSIAV